MQAQYTPKVLARFWSKVDQSGDCWLWMGAVMRNGYGLLTVHQRNITAHRFAYEAIIGPIPPHGCICHRCDVRRCVNPAHLFLGSQADNLADMRRKGRWHRETPRGERMGNAKLTDEKVRAMKRQYASGRVSTHQLAVAYGVSQTTVARIMRGVAWPHIAGSPA